jgi:hypothetical protein
MDANIVGDKTVAYRQFSIAREGFYDVHVFC